MILELRIKKEECDGPTCPLPLNLIHNVVKQVRSVKYNNKIEKAVVEYDEKSIDEKQVITKLKEIGYSVKKWQK